MHASRRSSIALLLLLLFSCKREPEKLRGYSYLYTSESKSAESSRLITARVYAAGETTRIEYEEGDGMILPKHTVVLSKDGGKTMIVLNSDEHTWYAITSSELTRRLGERFKTKAGTMNVVVTNVQSHVSDDGPDGYVEGFPVDKYIVTLSYDVRVSERGFSQTAPSQMKARVWTTKKIPEKHFAFLGEHGAHSGFSELDEHLSAAAKEVRGFPMRQKSQLQVNFGAAERATEELSEVKELHETEIDASLFEIPENYTEVSPKGRL